MSKEFNPEADVKGQIERLMLEIKELNQRREESVDPQADSILADQIKDLEDQAAFLKRQLP
ncbi:MAG: hypothetical protein KAV00_17625 [Phycisphaerae bacterium]|nr:hypothetical protein [Phycisphaerae bacterium]